MEKFNRIYSLKVEVVADTAPAPLLRTSNNIEITLPNTLEFTISRRNLSSAQTATFRVYNLAEEVRNAVQKDIFQFTQFRAIQFRAGYQPDGERFLPLVFNGTVSRAYSFRVDKDWITEIEAFDGGWQMANGNNVALTLSPGISAAEILNQLSRQLPRISGVPIIGNFPTTNKRGEVLFGNIWNLILEKSNGLATIDNGQVKALNYNEVFQGVLPVLSQDNGLLGSPKRTTSTLEFDMIFEPRLSVGQIIELRSVSNRQFNRLWKVLGFDHVGTISAAVSGDCLTKVRLWFTLEELSVIQANLVA